MINPRKAKPPRAVARTASKTNRQAQKAEPRRTLDEKLSNQKRKEVCDKLGRRRFPEQCPGGESPGDV